MEHTPGPWKVLRRDEESATYGEPIKRVKVVAPDGTIICDNEPSYPTELLEENANLIAASPELLEVVEFIFEACTRLNDAQAVTQSNEEMLAEELDGIESVTGAILAKVKGE